MYFVMIQKFTLLMLTKNVASLLSTPIHGSLWRTPGGSIKHVTIYRLILSPQMRRLTFLDLLQ